jgi:hypothetical protein
MRNSKKIRLVPSSVVRLGKTAQSSGLVDESEEMCASREDGLGRVEGMVDEGSRDRVGRKAWEKQAGGENRPVGGRAAGARPAGRTREMGGGR